MTAIRTLTSQWGLAARLARRELRQNGGGLWLIVLCLLFGITAIAALGNISASLRSSLADNARTILGGDLEARLLYRPADAAQRAQFESLGDVTSYVELRSMARRPDGADQRLVELKAVDETYPGLGNVTLDTGEDLQQALARRDGVWGVVADRLVLDRLDLDIGDSLRLGSADFQIRGVILSEPDRLSGGFSLGPRAMIALASLPETGFDQLGSLSQYIYKIRFDDPTNATARLNSFRSELIDQGWRLRGPDSATPQLRRFVDRLGLFLTLVGLGALLLGGIGIAQATSAYLDRRRRSVAIMACIGAPSNLIFKIYVMAVLMMGAIGIAAGVGIAAVVPLLLQNILADLFALPVSLRPDMGASAWAVAVGFATIMLYTAIPLLRIRHQPPASLFRAAQTPSVTRRLREEAMVVGLGGLLFGGLVIWTAQDRLLAAAFLATAVIVGFALRFLAAGLQKLAKRAARLTYRVAPRLAFSSMSRPGSALPSVMIALGFGMTVLVAVLQIDNNLRRELSESLPDRAPSFFFLDIQPNQIADFQEAVRRIDGQAVLESTPMLRGRITEINGVPVAQLPPEQRSSWVLQGDRGVTWSSDIPPHTQLVEGNWWPTDYDGPTKVSFDAEAAASLGLALGDSITVNILGRLFTAEIASFREVDWSAMNISFVMVFSPGLLENAPYMQLATVRTDPDREVAIERSVSKDLANVTIIRVKEALAEATRLLSSIGIATRLTAAVAVLVGLLVLTGAVLVGIRRRIDDAAIMKMLGADRKILGRAILVEYGVAGVLAAIIAGIFGTAAAIAFTRYVLDLQWNFSMEAVLVAIILGGGFAIAAALGVIWPVLRLRPAVILRRI